MLGSVKIAALLFDLVAQVLAESKQDEVRDLVVVHSGGAALVHPLDDLPSRHRVGRVRQLLAHFWRQLVEQRKMLLFEHDTLPGYVGAFV